MRRARRIVGVLAFLLLGVVAAVYVLHRPSAPDAVPAPPTTRPVPPGTSAATPTPETSAQPAPEETAKAAEKPRRARESDDARFVLVHVVAAFDGASVPRAELAAVGDAGVETKLATCDDDGRVRVPRDRIDGLVVTHAPGFLRVVLTARDFAGPEVRIPLFAADTFEGTVRDAATGAPIDGALVETSARDVRVQTAGGGRFRSDEWPHGRSALHVSAPGHATAQAFATLPLDAPFEIALAPAGRVRGVVTAADGAPVAGADVRVLATGRVHREGDWDAVTDAKGAYDLDDVAPGASIDVEAGTQDGGHAERTIDGPAAAGERVVCDLRLVKSAKWKVRVAWKDGAAIEGALVRVSQTGRDGEEETTYAKGEAEFDVDPSADVHVVAEAAGFETCALDRRPEPGVALELTLTPVAPVTGRVENDRGAAVEGAEVGDDDLSTTTDARGFFRLAFPDGTPRRLRVRQEDHDEVVFESVAPPRSEMRVGMRRLAGVVVRPKFPAGVDPWKGRLRTWWRIDEKSTPVNCACRGVLGPSEDPVSLTDRGGLMLRVPPRRVLVGFQFDGFAPVEREVDLAPGASLDWGEVTLAVAPTPPK